MRGLKKLPLWIYAIIGVVIVGAVTYVVMGQFANSTASKYIDQANSYIKNIANSKNIVEIHQSVKAKPQLQPVVFGSAVSTMYRDAEVMQAYIETAVSIIEDASAEAAVNKPIYEWYHSHYLSWMTKYYQISTKYQQMGAQAIAAGDATNTKVLEENVSQLREYRDALTIYINDLSHFHLPTRFYEDILDAHKKAISDYGAVLDEGLSTIHPESDKDFAPRNKIFLKLAYRQRDMFDSMGVMSQIEKHREKVVLASISAIAQSKQSLRGLQVSDAKIRAAAAVYISWAENSMPEGENGLAIGSSGKLITYWLDAFAAVARSSGSPDATRIVDKVAAAQTNALLLETENKKANDLLDPSFIMRLGRIDMGGIDKKYHSDPIELNTVRQELMSELPRPSYLQPELTELEKTYDELLKAAKAQQSADTPASERSAVVERLFKLADQSREILLKIAVKLDNPTGLQETILAQLGELKQ